ncbi:MAG: hypothetical protein Kow0010_11420 [Dehalococcoidia bacterium]
MLHKFAKGREPREMTFAEVEQLCANTGSILCGAAYAEPEALRATVEVSQELIDEAKVVAQRTGDAFRAALDDERNTLIAWPWDHLGTRIAWRATRQGMLDEWWLGDALTAVGTVYAIGFREQLSHVLDFWQRVASGVRPGDGSQAPDLAEMGRTMWALYQRERSSEGR